MMGRGHVLLGAATWVAAATYAHPVHQVTPHTVTLLALTALPAAGAALLPDIDHPGASIARSGGAFGSAIADGISAVSGGHRKGTHGLIFLAGVTAGSWWAVHAAGVAAALTIFALLTLWALRPLRLKHLVGTVLYLAGVAGLTAVAWHLLPAVGDWRWLPYAVAVGCASHLIGDGLTAGGVPLLWPLPHPRLHLPVLGHTNSVREAIFTVALAVTLIVMLAVAAGIRVPLLT